MNEIVARSAGVGALLEKWRAEKPVESAAVACLDHPPPPSAVLGLGAQYVPGLAAASNFKASDRSSRAISFEVVHEALVKAREVSLLAPTPRTLEEGLASWPLRAETDPKVLFLREMAKANGGELSLRSRYATSFDSLKIDQDGTLLHEKVEPGEYGTTRLRAATTADLRGKLVNNAADITALIDAAYAHYAR